MPLPSDAEPQIRVAQLKADLEVLPEIWPDRAGRIRVRLRPETLLAIESATRLDWMPFAVDLEVVEAVHAEVGDDGVREWSRRALLRTARAPLLKPLVDGAVRLFGLEPGGVLRFAPKVWGTIFRHCGDLEVVGGDREARVSLVRLPPAVRHHPFLVSIAGAVEATGEICRVQGRVTFEPRAASSDRADFVLRWTRG